MNIKWTDKITHEDIWRITNQKSIENQIKRRKWIGLDTITQKKQEQQRKPRQSRILRDIEEEEGRRERGEGQ